MKQMWRQLDGLLRARESVFTESFLETITVGRLLLMSVVLAAIYGFFMGWYAVFSRPEILWPQVISCIWKVPALFILTLFICYPSLYVFSTLLGSRLTFAQTLKTLILIVTIMVTVLASFGPIVAFFSLSTENYHFMKLLNVAFFAVAGFFGVGALLKALRSLLHASTKPEAPPASPPPALAETGGKVSPPLIEQRWREEQELSRINNVFRIWILLFALVGAQMGWVLRPFLGHPNSPFQFFRTRDANFFIDVWNALLKLFGNN